MGSGAGDLDVKGVEEGRGDRKSRGAQGEPWGAEAEGCDHSAPTGLGREVEGRAGPPRVLGGCQEEGLAWVQG